MDKPIVILGCTASGKSDLAETLAVRIGERSGLAMPATVMAVDSMQVYRGMDIGTAKPDAATRARIPHLMIDVADPWETYSAARFVEDARPHLYSPRLAGGNASSPQNDAENPEPVCNQKSKIKNQKSPIILIGGTILYLRALMEGLFEGPSADENIRAELQQRAAAIGTPALHAELARIDPAAAQRIHPNDLRRIVRALEVYRLTGSPISTLQTQWTQSHPGMEAIYIGVRREKDALSRRINARVKAMMEAGLLEEVRRLAADPRGFSQEAGSGVGYRQLLDYLSRKCSLDDAIEQIKIQTRHLAKMQRTWLKRWPPSPGVHWIDAADGEPGESIADRAMSIVDATSTE